VVLVPVLVLGGLLVLVLVVVVVGGVAAVDMDVQGGDTRKKMRKNKGRRWSRCSIVEALVALNKNCRVLVMRVPVL